MIVMIVIMMIMIILKVMIVMIIIMIVMMIVMSDPSCSSIQRQACIDTHPSAVQPLVKY